MATDEIHNSIRIAYGSLHDPNFSFVHQALAQRPYEPVVQELRSSAGVKDETDSNDDVSFVFILSLGERNWLLQLSMVGPYALLARLAEANLSQLLTGDSSDITESEVWIVQVLAGHRIRLLGPTELSEPIDLRLFNTDPGNVRIYQALFSDEDTLPWR